MKIKDIFKKNINRTIETVIKADDRDHISDEVVEYVITKEISNKVRDFFQAYNNYAGANGVWISGFFGSGKSHLLKILSYVLENKTFDGYKSGELFAEKIEDDEMLKADVMAATRIPSESILFNIDQQSQITSKADENAILSVFYKVFYDHLGFYGFQPHVAEFGMWLDKQGKYDEFEKKFEELNDKPWKEARIDYFDPLVTDSVAEVLGQIFNKDSSKYESILEDLEDKQKQSIEDFCNRVNSYINSKPKGFRINFFVDEVGQYISDNTKLMLNLQTIAETLATTTKGNSWILVTSQEDMERVVGDMTKTQQNDFSRIRDRFQLKIPLTSANVDEVIEKRILSKKEEPHKLLVKSHKKENAHLDTLLSFSDAGVQFKGYVDSTDFANKFPFIPYQFDLFQQCRRALSSHNAFQGKHASVGERSMLGVFQQVTKTIKEQNERTIVSFDMMYEGIRNELHSEIQSSIILAERNLDNRFAVKVLKVLFLVKYFSNFKTTMRNISVLMIDDIDVDLKKHEKKIEEALNTLENQSYVQRNGDNYEFLTDDEKDVEEEIKSTDIDDTATTQLLKEILFDEIIRDNRIRYIENRQDYDFTSKIDGAVLGREKELEIEIITQNYIDYDKESFHKSQTMGSNGMKMVLAPDSVFIKDVTTYLKTNKYIKQKQSSTNRPEVIRILHEKGVNNADRKKNLRFIANQLLANSSVYMNGSKHEMGSHSEGKTRVATAFQDLIRVVYSNLRMLGSIQFSEETIKNTIRANKDDLFLDNDSILSEGETEIINLINRRKVQSDRTSLVDLRNNFTRKPYGWYPNAIWTLTAKLYKRGSVEVKQDTNLLEDESVLNAILNTARHANTLLERQAEYDSRTVKKLKQVFADAFDDTCPLTEARDIATSFKNKLKELYVEVNQILAQKHEYPFLSSLENYNEKLGRLTKKEYSYFLTQIGEFEDDLLDFKEDYLDPIKRFMNGDQIKIYDSVRTILNGDTSNLNYIEGDEKQQLEQLLEHQKPYTGNLIRDAKTAKESLSRKVGERIKEERQEAIFVMGKILDVLENKPEFNQLDCGQKGEILKPLKDELKKVETQRYIAVIRDAKNRVKDKIYNDQLNRMIELLTPKEGDDDDDDNGGVKEPKPHYIRRSSVKLNFTKTELRTHEDVDEYVESLKKSLNEQINQNRRISL